LFNSSWSKGKTKKEQTKKANEKIAVKIIKK
jgi:hypothetical protein